MTFCKIIIMKILVSEKILKVPLIFWNVLEMSDRDRNYENVFFFIKDFIPSAD